MWRDSDGHSLITASAWSLATGDLVGALKQPPSPADRPLSLARQHGGCHHLTACAVVERLRQRFGVGHIYLVADRGMITAATIAAFEAQGIDYITGVGAPEPRGARAEDDGVAVPLLGGRDSPLSRSSAIRLNGGNGRKVAEAERQSISLNLLDLRNKGDDTCKM